VAQAPAAWTDNSCLQPPLLEQAFEEVADLLATVLLKLDETLLGGGLDALVDAGVNERCEDLLLKLGGRKAFACGAEILESDLGKGQGLVHMLS